MNSESLAPRSSFSLRVSARPHSVRHVPWIIAIPSLAAAAAVSIPLAYIAIRAADAGVTSYLAVILSRQTAVLLVRTLLLVAGVVAASLAIALPLAWLVVRTDLPGRAVWATAAAIPIVFPSYIAAFILVAVAGPRGYLQQMLSSGGVARLPEMAYGYSGALIALSLFTYPYLYLLLVVSLRAIDPALEESSRSLGMGRWRTFAFAIMPALRPALASGSLLIALYTLSDFGAVSIVRYNTFTVSIYNAYRALFDRTVAASLSTILVLVTFLFIATEAWLVRRARPVSASARAVASPVPLGRWRWPAIAFASSIVFATLVVPVATIGYWLLHGGGRGVSLAISLREIAGNSLRASLAAAIIAVALSIGPALWATRHPSAVSRWVDRIVYGGYALPGIVIALALVFFVSRWLPLLYQTAALLVIAYVIRFLPEAVSATKTALAAFPPLLEEAARSLGAGPLERLRTITLPLLRPGLLAGGGLVFLTSMKELPATLILRPIGFETLATRIWSATGEALYSEAALPALVLLLASAVPLYLLVIRPALEGRSRA
ncbi:MAG TPA: iron ABC transporter permease [Thermoanaerobaculia bacterium]|nr:iron ABC transporter permease [Thermoanaerobaculia bacterium]